MNGTQAFSTLLQADLKITFELTFPSRSALSPIILVGEIREGKIIKMREYFDLLTLTEAGTPHHLYS
jgi:hypothetical protein